MNYREKIFSKYAETHISHVYGEEEIGKEEAMFPVLRSYFKKLLPSNKSAEILDVACGSGGLIHWLHKIGYEKAAGIDISQDQVDRAGNMGIKNITRADMIAFLSSNKNKYSVIFMRDIIEHLKKDEILNILELAKESLVDGGQIIVQTPNAEAPMAARLRYCDFTHEISFTRDSLYEIFQVCGFSKIKIFAAGPVAHGIISFTRVILWKTIELLVRFYLLVAVGACRGIFTQSIIVRGEKAALNSYTAPS